MGSFFLLSLVASLSITSHRFDDSRTLVSINVTFNEFLSLVDPGRNIFSRSDFEAIRPESVDLWATPRHLEHLEQLTPRLNISPARDIGAISYEAEMARPGGRYMDSKRAEPDWTEYCGYDCLTERLAELTSVGGCEFPITLESIGKSADGMDIWVAKVGNRGPEILMAANIHGDETTGGQLFQRWLWETCNNPSREQDDIARSVQAYYMPMYNPDGYERNRRTNGNNADLNRDFPTVTGGGGDQQPETKAYIAFAERHSFDQSIMMHGGAVVCNYAYDSCYTPNIVPRPCPPASTELHSRGAEVLPSSKSYCDNLNVRCTVGSDCQTNGASWYQITGSAQDWAFHYRSTLDLTMEVTSTKRPAGSSLPGHYNDHKNAIAGFLKYPVRAKGAVRNDTIGVA